MFDDCIIMAGGSGTRLWPASNSKKQKQFLSAGSSVCAASSPGGKGSFFGAALERAFASTGRDGRVIIIAGGRHIESVIEVAHGFDDTERRRMILIRESEAKNTAPAILAGVLYSALSTGGTHPERSILVLTSDHIIGPLPVFAEDAAAASVFAAEGKLVVFGISPSRPETGYGYIETAGMLASPEAEVFNVASFREKPGSAEAEDFCAAGNFYWNSGMFGFSAEGMLEEYRLNAPLLYEAFKDLKAPGEGDYENYRGLRLLSQWQGLAEAYRRAQGISFDYAIAEKAQNTVMIRARFDWKDVGNWDEYASLQEAQKAAGNEVFSVYSKNCFVDSEIPVALAGVEDLIVVVRNGALLIVRKGKTQYVKDVVEEIKKAGRTDIL
ncbi:MAG: mannose-1-phosphate guanylyltransferase [Treponema sp.]|jgi:mannose-1-phosphate guanylyltransferase/mannose-1-phosphate guanylyltransferase/mannose-6-phosphate isomerase|nr:mannose-1-phosphate guanylyltransferase [Treponema sp.]